jgi:hypothetical protein
VIYMNEGERSSEDSTQIDATDGWAWPSTGSGFVLDWTITYDNVTELWTYTYEVSSASDGLSKNLSSFIVAVSDGALTGEFTDLRDNMVGVDTWGDDGVSDVEIPGGTMYGLKFGPGDTFSFTTARSPVWGNFYAQDGKDKQDDGTLIVVRAYNDEWDLYNGDAFPAGSSGNIDPYFGKILVPDSDELIPPTNIPEPGLSVLALGAFLAGVFARRRKGKDQKEAS